MNNIYKSKFNIKLKQLRKEKKLSQFAIAYKLKIPVSTYANWEQGRTEPSISDIFKLIDFFGIDANELFDIKDY